MAAVVLVSSAVHVWWLSRFRSGFPLDVDESGYMWYAFALHDELRADGIVGMWQRFQGEGWAGPLLPSVTALVQLSGGAMQILPSIAIQLLFLAVLAFASYGIGTRLLNPRAGLLTALVVVTVPAVIDFTRTYHLVVPAAAMYALATYGLLASNRLRSTAWAIAWGVALGLMLLSRSMMIAFLPALPVAALWIVIVDRADVRRLANLALGLLAAAGTALLWYATSWRPIFDYLLNFGYGDDSPGGAAGLSPLLSTEYWTDELVGTVNGSLYLPLAFVLVAALLFAAAAWVVGRASGARRAATWSRELRRATQSDAIVPAAVVAEGYLALTSSHNDGTGFPVPLLPPLVALAVVAAMRIPWRSVRIALVAALCATAMLNVVMKADVAAPMSELHTVDVPAFGSATLTNGQGYLHQHLVNELGYPLGPPTRWLPGRERGWLAAYDRIVSHLPERRSSDPRLVLAAYEPLLNSSAVRLAALRSGYRGGIFDHVNTGGEDSLIAYKRYLAAEAADVLVTTSPEGGHFGPPVTQRLVEAAAMQLGFKQADRFGIPDRRELRVWICCREKRAS